jgi:uncharacterized protein YaaQ
MSVAASFVRRGANEEAGHREADFRTTRLASTGGFLRRGNTTLMIGADESQVDYVLDLIRQTARSGMAPPESVEGIPPAAATVFVLDLEEYQRL